MLVAAAKAAPLTPKSATVTAVARMVRDSFMAALVLRTRSVDAARQAIEQGGIAEARHDDNQVVVPASSAFGVTLAFCL